MQHFISSFVVTIEPMSLDNFVKTQLKFNNLLRYRPSQICPHLKGLFSNFDLLNSVRKIKGALLFLITEDQ